MTTSNSTVARTVPLAPTSCAPDPTARTCSTCAEFRPVGDGHGGYCAGDRACRGMFSPVAFSEVRADFGCRFHAPADPSAYRAALVDAGVVAVFQALYAQAGRTSLPSNPEGIGRATRERLEIAVVRVLQSANVL